MMQANAKVVSHVPASVLTEVQNVAILQGVPEVWLFGSAANPDNPKKPNDWDFAMLGVQSDRWSDLSNSLKHHFPNSKIDSVLGYTISLKKNTPNYSPPCHFVLGPSDLQKQSHPIFSSINSGRRLYRAG